ncbi:MAG: hypothetical protein M5U01_06430 [Ardenticatenaceae bacterium]|nr:hypothetical protein [Ardenticatenaceae bacterium]HBY92725.1 hypothetical protein [Chloroflexota bacterium]
MTREPNTGHDPAIGHDEADKRVPCPFCGSDKTELHSLFGNMQLASQYYCHGCNTIFDAVTWRRRESPD